LAEVALPVPVPDRLLDVDVVAISLENEFHVAADGVARRGLDLAARRQELLLQLVEGLGRGLRELTDRLTRRRLAPAPPGQLPQGMLSLAQQMFREVAIPEHRL